ncbi:MAG: hypothetical protein HYX48_03630 [Chlamydiales bacterium]|nr:hypothetical protein [Chlamydiales bacterium]
MACVTALMRTYTEQLNQWMPHIAESFTVDRNATLLGQVGLSPRQEEWRRWSVQELSGDVARIRAAFEEAQSLQRWETFKSWAVLIGGILATPLIYNALVTALVIIIELPFNILEFVDHTFLASYLSTTPLDTGSVFLDLTIIFSVSWSHFVFWVVPMGLRFVYYAPRAWTKEIIPAIGSMDAYVSHLDRQVEDLEQALWTAERLALRAQ